MIITPFRVADEKVLIACSTYCSSLVADALASAGRGCGVILHQGRGVGFEDLGDFGPGPVLGRGLRQRPVPHAGHGADPVEDLVARVFECAAALGHPLRRLGAGRLATGAARHQDRHQRRQDKSENHRP
jgi:hypothetical protein